MLILEGADVSAKGATGWTVLDNADLRGALKKSVGASSIRAFRIIDILERHSAERSGIRGFIEKYVPIIGG